MEERQISSTGGAKGVKAQQYHLLPPLALRKVAQQYGFGARKYAAHNFRRGYEWSKTFDALQRHAQLFWAGEDNDSESLLSHTVSAAWHSLTLSEFFFVHQQFDDRPLSPNTGNGLDTPISEFSYNEHDISHHDFLGDSRTELDAEPRFDLIPARPIALLAEAYGSGALQPLNGRECGLWSDYYSKLQEHAFLYWGGENYDKHTGILHPIMMVHYAFSLIEAHHRFPERDDRLLEGTAPIGFSS